MNKPKNIVFASPIQTISGYGARSRDIARSLIQMYPGDNISFVPLRWGNTPIDYFEGSPDPDLESRIIMNITSKPDIFIHCTIPNEFQAAGHFNVGITAGIETDVCRPEWLEGCNKMDLVLASSNHSKAVFENSTFQKKDKVTQQLIEEIKLKAPVEVLFEALPEPHQFIKDVQPFPLNIEEDFAFLFVGHWLQGDFGQDRKDVGRLIHTFYETFKDTPRPPALILKTGATFSKVEKFQIEERIQNIQGMMNRSGFEGTFPSVYLIHGSFSDQEIQDLYYHPKIKCMVSFTKGEGFGRPLMEFAATGKPIMASNWSGQLDFLDPKYNTLLPGTINPVHQSSMNDYIIQGSRWFTVNYDFASNALKNCFNNLSEFERKARPQKQVIKTKFSMKKMAKLLKKYLDNQEKFLTLQGKPISKVISLPKRKK